MLRDFKLETDLFRVDMIWIRNTEQRNSLWFSSLVDSTYVYSNRYRYTIYINQCVTLITALRR
jgi:hypothetical protein